MPGTNTASASQLLKRRVETRQAVVGVVGLGYVGLPLCAAFVRRDFKVIGFDMDPAKIAAFAPASPTAAPSVSSPGTPRVIEPRPCYVQSLQRDFDLLLAAQNGSGGSTPRSGGRGSISPATPRSDGGGTGGSFEAVHAAAKVHYRRPDIFCICVPTPIQPPPQKRQERGQEREIRGLPDLSYVESAVGMIAAHGLDRSGKLIVLESTTYPGTTAKMRSLLELRAREHAKKGSGSDDTVGRAEDDDYFFLAFSPERVDPGNDMPIEAIPKLVGGTNCASGDVAMHFYRTTFEEVVLLSSAEAAEAAKLVENVYRNVNIALVNELRSVFNHMRIDIHEVLQAASTKPFGFSRFYPGPGVGGHCIPVDPKYLTWAAQSHGANTPLISTAVAINESMPTRVTQRVKDALKASGVTAEEANVLLLGVAYKPNVEDCRHAPAFIIWEELLALGATVSYHDPHVPSVPQTRDHPGLQGARSIELCKQSVIRSNFDAAVLITDHAAILEGIESVFGDTRCVIIDTKGSLHNRKVSFQVVQV